jgi:putative ABC transport system permease protein
VAIINETAALRLWPNTQALGQRLMLGKSAKNAAWISVVGVVKDFKDGPRDRVPQPQVFLPYTQMDPSQMTLTVRTFNNPDALTAAIRDQISAVDKNQPVWGVATMERRISLSVWQPRVHSWVFSVFAAIALVLVTLGVYSVTAYLVRQRTHDIAIRMALGARKWQILKPILGHGLLLAATGIVIGLFIAFAIARVLSGLLYGVTPTDPKAFVGMTLLLLGVVLVANLIPALRAIRIDPIVALREN